MGKAALMIVVAASLGSGVVYMSQDRQAFETQMTEALYTHGALAREAAKSGFNRATRRVMRNFEGHRTFKTGIDNQGGEIDISVADGPGGTVVVTVTGFHGEAEFTITGTLEKSGARMLDALSIDGPVKKVELKDDSWISGLDANPDGSDGSNTDVHAILSTLVATHAEVVDVLEDDAEPGYGVGVGGTNDVIQGSIEMDLGGLVQAITAYGGPLLTDYTDDVKLEDNDTIGSSASPRVVRVDGKFEMKDEARGYGILYVTSGDIKIEDDARWEGLIIGSSAGGKFEFTKQASVYGAVVLSAVSEDGAGGDSSGDGGLPGGHFDVDVFDALDKIYHEHQYDDDFDRTDVSILENTAECGDDGALCWDEVMTGVTEGWVAISNYENSSGTYRFKNADMDIQGDLTGNASDTPAPVLMDLTTLEELSANFDALCMLIESSPGGVKSDNVNRNQAFTIEIYANGPGDVQGALLYELSVYHHYSGDFPCGGGGDDDDDDDGGGSSSYGGPIEITIKDDAHIQYSAQALAAALALFPDFSMSDGGVAITSQRESGVRPTRRLSTGAISDQ